MVHQILKLLENKTFKLAANFPSVIKYAGLALLWINLTYTTDTQNFFDLFEKKIGLEIVLLLSIFFLVGFGQNFTNDKKLKESPYQFLVPFVIISTFIIFFTRHSTQLLYSSIIILAGNLIDYITKSGEYGAAGNDLFMSGRGPVFCFALGVSYGIPTGLVLKHFNLWESPVAIGNAIIFYYIILLFFEAKYFLKFYF